MRQVIRRETRERGRGLVGIPGHAKVRAVVSLQADGHDPFLARRSDPNCSLWERVKLVEVLCVCAQHTGTQITAPLSSGAIQAAEKRHARQHHALGQPRVQSCRRLDQGGALGAEVGGASRRAVHTASIRRTQIR